MSKGETYTVWMLWAHIFDFIEEDRTPTEDEMFYLGTFDSKDKMREAAENFLASLDWEDFGDENVNIFRTTKIEINKCERTPATKKQMETYIRRKKAWVTNKDSVKFDL